MAATISSNTIIYSVIILVHVLHSSHSSRPPAFYAYIVLIPYNPNTLRDPIIKTEVLPLPFSALELEVVVGIMRGRSGYEVRANVLSNGIKGAYHGEGHDYKLRLALHDLSQ